VLELARATLAAPSIYDAADDPATGKGGVYAGVSSYRKAPGSVLDDFFLLDEDRENSEVISNQA